MGIEAAFHSPYYALYLNADDLGTRVRIAARASGALVYEGTLIDGHLTPVPETGEEALRLLFQGLLRHGPFTLPLSLRPALTAAGAAYQDTRLHVTEASMAVADRAKGCKGAAWLERPQPSLPVVAIALIDGQDRVLLAQRPAGKSFAGLWEFPGGKIEAGESPELALCREVREELGLHVWNACLSPLTFVSHAYDGFHLTLLAYVCYKFEGRAQGREGQTLKWWATGDLRTEAMPPANAPLIHALKDLLG